MMSDFIPEDVKKDFKDFYKLLKKRNNLIRFISSIVFFTLTLFFIPQLYGLLYFFSVIFFYFLTGVFFIRDIIGRMYAKSRSFINVIVSNIVLINLILFAFYSVRPLTLFFLINHIYFIAGNQIISLLATIFFVFQSQNFNLIQVIQKPLPEIVTDMWHYYIQPSYNIGSLFNFVLNFMILFSYHFKYFVYFVKWDRRIPPKIKHLTKSKILSGGMLFLLSLLTYEGMIKPPHEDFALFEQDKDSLA